MPEQEPPHDEQEPTHDQDHYDMLMRCSEAGDMSEWNSWRKENGKTTPQLQKANLWQANLQGANLWRADLQGANLELADLQGADLGQANLQGANLWLARLQGARLGRADLQGANLEDTNLQGADLGQANLQGAHLWRTDLQRARLGQANLQGAHLEYTNLQGADLGQANLQGADLWRADLQGANLGYASVDGRTNFNDCRFDRNTYFGGIALGASRMDPGLKTALEGNIRRIEWGKWYKKKKFLQWLVRPFWWVSDYGMKTTRILGVFFALAFVFGILYYTNPDLIHHLKEVENHKQVGGPPLPVTANHFLRAMYFSIVTMTTLGFGDMHAHPDSDMGHILLILQVLFGYGLLGALITRLAILFQSLGPAQGYSSSKKQEKKDRK